MRRFRFKAESRVNALKPAHGEKLCGAACISADPGNLRADGSAARLAEVQIIPSFWLAAILYGRSSARSCVRSGSRRSGHPNRVGGGAADAAAGSRRMQSGALPRRSGRLPRVRLRQQRLVEHGLSSGPGLPPAGSHLAGRDAAWRPGRQPEAQRSVCGQRGHPVGHGFRLGHRHRRQPRGRNHPRTQASLLH